jgi:hypothetical protein
MAPYPVELTISFEGSSGVTLSVSREEVRFVTDVPLVPGQVIEGALRTPDARGGIVTTLRYTARVAAAHARDGGWDVLARFADLGFAAPGTA